MKGPIKKQVQKQSVQKASSKNNLFKKQVRKTVRKKTSSKTNM